MLFKRTTHLRNFSWKRMRHRGEALELSMEQAILLKPCLRWRIQDDIGWPALRLKIGEACPAHTKIRTQGYCYWSKVPPCTLLRAGGQQGLPWWFSCFASKWSLWILVLFFFLIFIYFWLHCVFIATRGLSLVAVSQGFSCCETWALEHGFGSFGAWA